VLSSDEQQGSIERTRWAAALNHTPLDAIDQVDGRFDRVLVERRTRPQLTCERL
jgi:hypothetical protein